MSHRVYNHINISGASTQSRDHAIVTALKKAGETVRDMQWYRVTQVQGLIADDSVKYWQVTIEVGIAVEELKLS